MPSSEPFEVEFVSPIQTTFVDPVREDQIFNQSEKKKKKHAKGNSDETVTSVVIRDVEEGYKEEDQGVKVVSFTPGTGENPKEWGKAKKWYITITVSFLCLAVTLGSSTVTGDMTGPTKEFGTSQEIINLTITCFVIGFGIGPLIFAPLSELVGRTPMYLVSMFFYCIFTLPSALAHNAATLVIARQIAGLAASAPMCNVGGSIADIWSVEERGIPMAFFSFTIFMGPCLGPVMGGWIGERAGWRWLYWVLFIFSGFCFVLTLFLPETLAPVVLRRKAAKLRKETGDSSYRTVEEIEGKPFMQNLRVALSRPLIMLFTEPIVIMFSIYLSFVYALLYLMFFAFPIAFAEIRHFSGGMTGVTFVSIIIGIGIAMCLLPFNEKIYAALTKKGTYPEARLYGMMLGAIVLPISLFMFAFTGAFARIHWIAPLISGAVFGFSMIVIYVSANSYIVDSYSAYAASAIAAKTLLRSEIAAMVPLFVDQMFHGMGFQYAGLLLALVAVAIGPIPYVFFIYGERIRKRSVMATQAVRRR
ncbi:hypothetical protein E1B28_003726 [Marasmius oreades]|uniref:Major facilitator superfamily (MFS) profile domain-containing protein n=1 Tax=Marasmius oreades TaxID=181124 RepID=A0A9P7UX57_9AGAR|nr:uncharacterized protein E1B28_003726 [Marasmius oreades]KAG7096278.1 hypothetical protein E1B28_003726 [Marasmius oreades]